MEILIFLRSASLPSFVLAVALMAYATFNRNEPLYLTGLAAGSWGITAFLLTESFGRIAQTRSIITRWIARFLLTSTSSISSWVIYLIMRWCVLQDWSVSNYCNYSPLKIFNAEAPWEGIP